jgi:type IV pilus assembly protein PilO
MPSNSLNFKNLPRRTQMIIGAVCLVCMAILFYMYYLKDQVEKRDALIQENHKLEVAIEKGAAVEARLKKFKKELAVLEEKLAFLQSILPSEKETPSVLRSVQTMAASSNLKIKRFTPQPVVPREFYSEWPIRIEVDGSYDGLGTFFEKIGNAARIIDVGTIDIQGLDKQPESSRTLAASCTATTFVYREDPPPSAPESANQKKGKRRN